MTLDDLEVKFFGISCDFAILEGNNGLTNEDAL